MLKKDDHLGAGIHMLFETRIGGRSGENKQQGLATHLDKIQ